MKNFFLIGICLLACFYEVQAQRVKAIKVVCAQTRLQDDFDEVVVGAMIYYSNGDSSLTSNLKSQFYKTPLCKYKHKTLFKFDAPTSLLKFNCKNLSENYYGHHTRIYKVSEPEENIEISISLKSNPSITDNIILTPKYFSNTASNPIDYECFSRGLKEPKECMNIPFETIKSEMNEYEADLNIFDLNKYNNEEFQFLNVMSGENYKELISSGITKRYTVNQGRQQTRKRGHHSNVCLDDDGNLYYVSWQYNGKQHLLKYNFKTKQTIHVNIEVGKIKNETLKESIPFAIKVFKDEIYVMGQGYINIHDKNTLAFKNRFFNTSYHDVTFIPKWNLMVILTSEDEISNLSETWKNNEGNLVRSNYDNQVKENTFALEYFDMSKSKWIGRVLLNKTNDQKNVYWNLKHLGNGQLGLLQNHNRNGLQHYYPYATYFNVIDINETIKAMNRVNDYSVNWQQIEGWKYINSNFILPYEYTKYSSNDKKTTYFGDFNVLQNGNYIVFGGGYNVGAVELDKNSLTPLKSYQLQNQRGGVLNTAERSDKIVVKSASSSCSVFDKNFNLLYELSGYSAVDKKIDEIKTKLNLPKDSDFLIHDVMFSPNLDHVVAIARINYKYYAVNLKKK